MSASSSIYSGGACSQEELAEKYQKLLPEYYRTKAQHSVLKKAVLTEKANNVKLQDQLKSKEQELRKLEQELDVLNFLNNSLAKKVEILQESKNKSSVKGWISNTTKKQLEDLNIKLEAAMLDLQTKIFENETLHRELDSSKTANILNHEKLEQSNQELENRLQKLMVEHQESENFHTQAFASLTKQKENIQLEVQHILELMQNLHSEQTLEMPSVPNIVKEPIQELTEINNLVRNSYSLLNADHDTSNWVQEFPSAVVKELVDGTPLQMLDKNIEQLIIGLRLIFEATEKREVYLSEHMNSSDSTRFVSKLRENHRRMNRSLLKLKTSSVSLAKESYINWLETGSNSFQSTRSFQDLRASCDELFNSLVEIASYSLSHIHAEKSIFSPSNEADEIVLTLEKKLQDLVSNSKNIAIKSKAGIASGHDFLESFQLLRPCLFSVFKTIRDKLTIEGKSNFEFWLLKTLNAQIVVNIISNELILQNIFYYIEKWLILIPRINSSTYSQTRDSSETLATSAKLKASSEISGQTFHREFSSTFTSYEESLNILSSVFNNQKEKNEMRSMLEQEQEKSKELELLLNSFQNQVKILETELASSQEMHRDLDEKFILSSKDLENKEQIIEELKKQIRETDENIIRLLESEDEIDSKRSHKLKLNGHIPNGEVNLLSDITSIPQMQNGFNNESKLVKINGGVISDNVKENISASNNEMVSDEPLKATPKEINFSADISKNDKSVENFLKEHYETKVKSLTEKIETADSQALRFHDAWLEISNDLDKSRIENQKLRETISLLSDQLSKSKDDFESLEIGYKKHIEDMTEQIATMLQNNPPSK